VGRYQRSEGDTLDGWILLGHMYALAKTGAVFLGRAFGGCA
jgi:hypothetical protein